jgi:hypothetical protein
MIATTTRAHLIPFKSYDAVKEFAIAMTAGSLALLESLPNVLQLPESLSKEDAFERLFSDATTLFYQAGGSQPPQKFMLPNLISTCFDITGHWLRSLLEKKELPKSEEVCRQDEPLNGTPESG